MNKKANAMGEFTPNNSKIEDNSETLLDLLNVVHENSELTQRSMASELGIALGLANTYLKHCVRKGYIKVRQIPSNRYSYYLTPIGFAEKSRLTAEYLSYSFNFFRKAKSQCLECLHYARGREWDHLALVGVSDLAEIFALCALDNKPNVIGIYDPYANRERFAGIPVVNRLSKIDHAEGLILTDTDQPQITFDELCQKYSPARILTLPVLGISRNLPTKVG